MIYLISFCDLPWWLLWLVPFLLGLLLGWLIWSKYQRLLAESEDRNRQLNSNISKLNEEIARLKTELEDCRKRRIQLEGDLALSNGRVNELERALSAGKGDLKLKASATAVPEASAAMGIASAGMAKKPSAPVSKYAALKNDNLQIVEGIGPKMEAVCKENGINTWADLASKSPDELKSMLGKYGDKYRIIDPKSWAQQAALARDGQWDELITLQKQLDGGKSDSAVGLSDAKVEKIMIKLGIIKKYKQDDLKAVEGIGPKIEGLLHDAGIKTWEALASTEVDRIKAILVAAGKRYQLADPMTWPQQARLAADGKWEDLDELQDRLKGGRI